MDYSQVKAVNYCFNPFGIAARVPGKPVWSAEYGWLLVNAIDRVLLLPNGQMIPFADSRELYTLPQLFSEPVLPSGSPLTTYGAKWLAFISETKS